jgi:hypothetical protein
MILVGCVKQILDLDCKLIFINLFPQYLGVLRTKNFVEIP